MPASVVARAGADTRWLHPNAVRWSGPIRLRSTGAASQSNARFSAAATQLSCTAASLEMALAAHFEQHAWIDLLAKLNHGL